MMDSPLVKKQKDLRQALREAYLADYFEHVCQTDNDTTHALLRVLAAEPNARLIVGKLKDTETFTNEQTNKTVIAGLQQPNGSVTLVSLDALLALVHEAKSIYEMTRDLLDWMKEKKLDQ